MRVPATKFLVAVVLLITGCTQQQAGQAHPRGEQQNDKIGTPRKAMNVLEPITRYSEYLRTFGIIDAGNRVAELRDLDVGDVRFFAYVSSDGVRLKAAASPSGLVTPGGRASDDWYGFLSRVRNAATAAERIAWLESDESTRPHALPNPPTVVLTPERPLAAGIDPAQWGLVTSPTLLAGSDGSAKLTAWFLTGGTRVPMKWTIAARLGEAAAIERVSAYDLLVENAGSVAIAARDAKARARTFLVAGTDDERLWALQQVGDTNDRASVLDVAALLTNAGASSDVRLHAAGTLARIGDPAAVTALGAALRSDTAPEVRRQSALALGRIGGSGSLQVLAAASADEPDVIVRAEIVGALIAQGSAALGALSRIARTDPDMSIRARAQGGVDALNPVGRQ